MLSLPAVSLPTRRGRPSSTKGRSATFAVGSPFSDQTRANVETRTFSRPATNTTEVAATMAGEVGPLTSRARRGLRLVVECFASDNRDIDISKGPREHQRVAADSGRSSERTAAGPKFVWRLGRTETLDIDLPIPKSEAYGIPYGASWERRHGAGRRGRSAAVARRLRRQNGRHRSHEGVTVYCRCSIQARVLRRRLPRGAGRRELRRASSRQRSDVPVVYQGKRTAGRGSRTRALMVAGSQRPLIPHPIASSSDRMAVADYGSTR